MEALHLIHSQSKRNPDANFTGTHLGPDTGQVFEGHSVDESPKVAVIEREPDNLYQTRAIGGFFKGPSIKAKNDFELLTTEFECPHQSVLIREKQRSSRVMLFLHGNVKILLNSFSGRRCILQVAGAGDILGIASAVSGTPSDVTAESMYPCRIASLKRQDFLD